MAKSQKFEEYVRLSLQMFGEEIIRRSKELELGGLDACTNIHISYDIPTWRERIEFPTFRMTFECYDQTTLDGIIDSPTKFKENKEEN